MSRKLAVKKLTASDLTLFEWQFRNRNAGNQKAINLNTDVFIHELYPILPDLVGGRGGRVPLDLQIYGPGLSGLLNLQRKIVKFGTYKNWRLNGEFIHNPPESPTRFNILAPGDFVILEFVGIDLPVSAKAIFMSHGQENDTSLCEAFELVLGGRGMATLHIHDVEEIINRVNPSPDHPIHVLTLTKELEDLIATGDINTKNVIEKPSLRKISKEDLLKAKKNADDNGRKGEEFVNAYFGEQLVKGQIKNYLWESDANPLYPYDFHYFNSANEKVLVEVKTTQSEFGRDFYFSYNELRQALEAERYHLYRVYGLEDSNAFIKISENVRDFASQILDVLGKLPHGVKANGISLSPDKLQFGNELKIKLNPDLQE